MFWDAIYYLWGLGLFWFEIININQNKAIIDTKKMEMH